MNRAIRLLTATLLGLAASAAAQAARVKMLWLGQPCWKIATPSGKVIVIDPWLIHDPKTPPEYKKLEALGKVDLILVTHAHGDHFEDAPALSNLNHAPVVGPQGLNASIKALGLVPPELAIRMGRGGTTTPWGPRA